MSGMKMESHALSASAGKANLESPLEPWDSAELLQSIDKPLVLEVSPLRSVLSSLYDRIELMAAHQNKMLNTLGDLSERVNVLAAAEQAKPPPPTIDEETKAVISSLRQFSKMVDETGGLAHISKLRDLVDAAGGAENINSNLALFNEVAQRSGGPVCFADGLKAFHETLDTAGSVEDLVNLLQSARDLCAAAGGPKACIELLQSSKSLVVAAGGARELVQLLETVSEFVKASGGPQALADVLETVSSLCSAAGGSDALVAMLKAALAIINAYGGADEAHKLMSQLSDMVNAMGGSKAFADAIAQLLRDLMRLISGAGGVDELVRLLLEGPRQVVADSAPNGIPDSKYAANLELLASLKSRVTDLENAVTGFNKTIEELRAAGRVEAMEDLMTNLLGQLGSAEKARETADREMRAQQEQSRKERLQATQSIRTGSHIPRTATRDLQAASQVTKDPTKDATKDTSATSKSLSAQRTASPLSSNQPAPQASAKPASSQAAQKTDLNSNAAADVATRSSGARRQRSRMPAGADDEAPAPATAAPGRPENAVQNLDIKQPGAAQDAHAPNERRSSSQTGKSHEKSDRPSGSRAADQVRVTRFSDKAELDAKRESGLLAKPESASAAHPSGIDASHAGTSDASGDVTMTHALRAPETPPPGAPPTPFAVERPLTPALPDSVTGEISATSLATDAVGALIRPQTAAGDPGYVQNGSTTGIRHGIASYDPMMHQRNLRSRSLSPASATPPSISDYESGPEDTIVHEHLGDRCTTGGAGRGSAERGCSPPPGSLNSSRSALKRPQTSHPGSQSRSAGPGSTPKGKGNVGELQLPITADPVQTTSGRRNVKGLFKAKALEIMKEKHLGAMKRFASVALQSMLCRVEKPVHEVLQKLTSLQSSGPPGASLDDIDELHVRLDEGLERTMDLEAAVAELLEIKADKAALAKLGQVVRDLWKAVQELQGPEGDEHRGVKQVHGKCISCDRPLNIIRDSRLGSLSISIDAFGPGWPGPRGPGWETGPKRALGNRDMEAYWELLSASRRGSSPPKIPRDGNAVCGKAPGKPDNTPSSHPVFPRMHEARPATSPAGTSQPAAAALRKMDRARNKQLLQLQPANPVSLQSAQIGSTSARHAGRGKPDGAASPTI